MTTKENKKVAMTILGAAFFVCLFMAAPMIEMANDSGFTDSTLGASQSSTGFIREDNAMGITAGGWYANYLIDAAGYGYCVWVGSEGAIITNGTHISNSSSYLTGSTSYLAQNVSINYKKTTGIVTGYQGWKTWGSTVSLKKIIQRPQLGFMDAAIDAKNNLNVFFSNDTISNSSTVYDRFTATLWNVTSGVVSNVSSQKQGWKSALNDGDLSQSILTKGVAGKIAFYGSATHLAWNNGTNLFYQLRDGAITNTSIASATYMGECSMVISSTGQLTIAYSKGATIAGKKVFTRIKPNGGAFASEVQQTTASFECITPSVFLDSSDVVHIVWSAQVNTSTSGSHFRYVIQYFDGSTIRNVSTDIGTLTAPTATTPIVAFSPKGTFYNGKLNILYLDNRVYNGFTGGNTLKTKLVWQYYPGIFTDNVFKIISTSVAGYDDYTFNLVKTSVDDIIVAYHAVSSGPSVVNLAKIDVVAPALVVTSASTLDLPESFALTFTITEDDIGLLTVTWDGVLVSGVLMTDRSVAITGSGLTSGQHSYVITIGDEVGNQPQPISGRVTFTDPFLTLIFIAVAGGAAAVIIIAIYYSKNKAKFMKKKLELKMGGKAPEDSTWGDEGAGEDEGSSGEDGSMDLKKDLKKVDM